jgi:hypothetical protein
MAAPGDRDGDDVRLRAGDRHRRVNAFERAGAGSCAHTMAAGAVLVYIVRT